MLPPINSVIAHTAASRRFGDQPAYLCHIVISVSSFGSDPQILTRDLSHVVESFLSPHKAAIGSVRASLPREAVTSMTFARLSSDSMTSIAISPPKFFSTTIKSALKSLYACNAFMPQPEGVSLQL